MLADTLSRGMSYGLGAFWGRVFNDLLALAARGADLPEGEYPLAGGPEHGGAKAMVSVYTSKKQAEGRYESHEVMADIQIVLEGEEYIGIIPREGLTLAGAYDPNLDISFYCETPPPSVRVHLKPGHFALVLPQDAHMPGMTTDAPARVKKLVVKLPAGRIDQSL